MTFHKMTMKPDEKFEQYVGRLRIQGRRCGYSGQTLETEVRDRAIAGCKTNMQEKLLHQALDKGDSLTLQQVLSLARVWEETRRVTQEVQHEDKTVNMTQKFRGKKEHKTEEEKQCMACMFRGHSVGSPRCPARAKKCAKCGLVGHFARCCRTRMPVKQQVFPRQRSAGVHAVNQNQVTGHDEGEMHLNLWEVEGDDVAGISANASVSINGRDINMMVDTGSPVSIVSKDVMIPGMRISKSLLKLKSFTGHQIALLGESDVTVKMGKCEQRLRLVVADMSGHRALMGRDWIAALKVSVPGSGEVKVVEQMQLKSVLEKHKEVFKEGLGHISIKAHLTLKPDARPVFRKARPVPHALFSKVDAELDRWLEEGVAERVDRNTNTGWGTPLVPVPKADGNVRLAADYRITVNPQLMMQKHPLPTPEEMFVRIKGKRFCKLDLKDAYLQMELDDESKEMTTVTTHKGLLRMNRLPFRICSCGDIFQAAMDRILEGLDGCVCYLDDLLVMGESEEEMLKNLEQVLRRLKEHGVRLKEKKCKFNLEEVTYLGWRISGTDLKPVPEKIEALQNMPEPKDVSELRTLLGSVNYYHRLIPNMATVMAPLYNLLKKNVKWNWTAECSKAMKMVKQILASEKVLMRYNTELPLKLITDASAVGVGAVLVHQLPDGLERPVCYSSRTLTPTEKKYAVVEKEALAVSFGIKKFQQCLYGRRFCLVTDNRALSLILNPERELPSLVTARMQRYALQLAAYAYEVELRKSESMGIADTLSRMPLPTENDEDEEAWCPRVLNMEHEGPTLSAAEAESATRRDPVLGRVLQYVRSGWPEKVDDTLRVYQQKKDELSTEGDCLIWGGRLLVPMKLRKKVLQEVHTGHMGSNKMKQLARRYVWWPGLDSELEDLARGCSACVEKRSAPPRSTLHPWEPTSGPWERVHVDFAGPFQGTMILIVVDSYSKWIEAVTMKTTTAGRTVEELRKMFAGYGLPLQIVSDNGTQFTSEEFATFVRMNGIRHIRVAPFHPQSNGAAEKAVQTVKNGLRANQNEGGTVEQSLARFLMAHRSTPLAATKKSPAELLYGRNIRTRMDLIRPDRRGVQRAQEKQVEEAGGRHRVFQDGEEVWARSYAGPKWRRGKILTRTGPVSYEVDVGTAVWSRHADQILHAESHREDGGREDRREKSQERQQREDGGRENRREESLERRRTSQNREDRRDAENQERRKSKDSQRREDKQVEENERGKKSETTDEGESSKEGQNGQHRAEKTEERRSRERQSGQHKEANEERETRGGRCTQVRPVPRPPEHGATTAPTAPTTPARDGHLPATTPARDGRLPGTAPAQDGRQVGGTLRKSTRPSKQPDRWTYT